MYRASSAVRPVTFGTAIGLTLDNYYDLLKGQAGTLNANEFLQLKLAADVVDISANKKASKGGYVWFSYYNLVKRSDRAIQPLPVSGQVEIGLASLASVYGNFLRRLRTYVTQHVLTPEEQQRVAELQKDIDSLKDEAQNFLIADRAKWKEVAEAMGYSVADDVAYLQWAGDYGHRREIKERFDQVGRATFNKHTILNRQYPDPDDAAVVKAEVAFDNPLMQTCFPIHPDYMFPNGDSFNPIYLTGMVGSETGNFEKRYATSFTLTLDKIKTTGAAHLNARLDRTTGDSSSIGSDWSASTSGGFAFLSASASASEHVKIQEDFAKATSIELSSKSVIRLGVSFPSWFEPTLFQHKHIKAHLLDFAEFFGPTGTLLYYPTALILIRGFEVSFKSSQAWTYDYSHQFSASGGGGFNAFGISFGNSASYGTDNKAHHVDTANTNLTIGDDAETIRFVGYAVMKNRVFESAIEEALRTRTSPEPSERKPR